MKLSLLIFLSLSILTFPQEVTVTKSFSESKSYDSSNPDTSTSNPDSGSGSSSEIPTPAPINPGADSYNACDLANRPSFCTLEYVPVCGYIHECEGGACTATFGNGCQACSLDYVDGYVNGACEDVQTACDPDNRPEACPEYYTATCAVAGDCQGDNCFENVANSCFACSIEGVAYSLPGECPKGEDNKEDERVYCDVENRSEVCPADYDPVCAHTGNCLGELCWRTAGNACGACGDENVDFYEPGECSDHEKNDEEDDGKVDCDDEERSEVCTADYNPVCGHISGCEGDSNECWSTAGNACSACGNENVDYYIPGECEKSERL